MMLPKIALTAVALAGIASADPKPDSKLAPAKPEVPKPPAELDAVAKQMVGNWKCKGDSFDPAGAKTAVTATITSKLDLEKFWIADAVVVKGGPNLKMNMFTTYDAKAGKWRRVSVDSWGGYMVGTSDGMKDNKIDWNLDTVGPQGTGLFRDHVDTSDAKAMKLWGQMSMDKSKTWTKVYEMTCTK